MSKYQTAQRRLEKMANELEDLKNKIKKQPPGDTVSEETREELRRLELQMLEQAEAIDKLSKQKLPFDAVLKAAQAAGYAEAEPSLDIDGHDTAHKALVLASRAYGCAVPLTAAHVEGIRGLAKLDDLARNHVCVNNGNPASCEQIGRGRFAHSNAAGDPAQPHCFGGSAVISPGSPGSSGSASW